MSINYKDYHENWKAISRSIIRDRAKHHCELCNAENGKPHWKTGGRVTLTVHHIIHGNKKNIHPLNLIALCNRCHLRLDLPFRIIKKTKNG